MTMNSLVHTVRTSFFPPPRRSIMRGFFPTPLGLYHPGVGIDFSSYTSWSSRRGRGMGSFRGCLFTTHGASSARGPGRGAGGGSLGQIISLERSGGGRGGGGSDLLRRGLPPRAPPRPTVQPRRASHDHRPTREECVRLAQLPLFLVQLQQGPGHGGALSLDAL